MACLTEKYQSQKKRTQTCFPREKSFNTILRNVNKDGNISRLSVMTDEELSQDYSDHAEKGTIINSILRLVSKKWFFFPHTFAVLLLQNSDFILNFFSGPIPAIFIVLIFFSFLFSVVLIYLWSTKLLKTQHFFFFFWYIISFFPPKVYNVMDKSL